MGQIKSAEVDGFLRRGGALPAVVLVYGPDRGLVSERARRCVELSGASLDDPFGVVRLDAAEIDRDPGRLHDEVGTISMFGGRRTVWVRNAGAQKTLAGAVDAVCRKPSSETSLVIEAGDLKKSATLRTTVEASPAGLALPCYPDDARLLDGLIEAELSPYGITIEAEARELLRQNLGADRMASRMEVSKLALYAMDRATITSEDVLLLTGDVSGASADFVIHAAIDGDGRGFDRLLGRALSAGITVSSLLSAALRILQQLHLLRGQMDAGQSSASSVTASVRPPLYGSRRAAMETNLQLWNTETLARTLEQVHDLVLRSRVQPSLANPLFRSAMIEIVSRGRRRRALKSGEKAG